MCHSCSSSTSVMQQSRPFGFSRNAYSDRKPVLMILRLQFLALKCGSGKQMKIFSRLSLGKYWHRCLMVFVLTTLMWSYLPGFWMRQPRIFSETKFTSLSRIYIPRMSLSGKRGARPKSSPPQPQPTSMMETLVPLREQFLGCSQKEGCSTVLQQALWLSQGEPWRRRGQWAFQSTQEWWAGQGKGVELRGLMWARMRQSFFLGMSLSSLSILRLPSSCSDSSLCFRSRFIKEIQRNGSTSHLISNASRFDFVQMQFIQNLAHYIEHLAHTSLYDLNHANKSLAQQEFTAFIFRLPPAQYQQLLESSSENVVFAFAAVLLKNVSSIKEHILTILPRVNEVLMKWYQPNGTLRRQQGEPLKLYIENTYGQFMGNCLKLLFRRPENKNMVNNFLDNLGAKPHYRLFLYFRFIESVSSIEEDISYVDYRTLQSSFQETFIPRIFEALFPYFTSISDAMDISELAFLHSSLSVNEEQAKCVLEFSGKNRFTEMVFQLLGQVIAFRYNISHREYEEMEEFENVQISFPESLLKEIMRQSFLEALYNILIQLMRTNEFKYQEICLNCLKKILLAKITYIERDLQTPFIFSNMQGVLKLLSLILANKVSHRLNALNILQCAYNFVRTFGLDDIEGKMQADERYVGLLRQWLQVAKAVPIFILQYDNQPLDSENELFLAAVEMTTEIANELKINNIRYNKDDYVHCYRALTNAFLDSFITKGKNILGSKPFSFEELQKSVKDFLGNMKVIFTYNYGETFLLLNKCCDYLYKTEGGEFNIANLILLLNEMIRESCFIQESIFGKGLMSNRQGEMEEIGGELSIFAEVLAKTLTFILKYQSETDLPYPYLNNAIVLFLCTLLDRSSARLSTGEMQNEVPPFINDELYRRIKTCMHGSNDQQFLLNCLFALVRFIRCSTMCNIDFIFIWLFKIISQIKHHMRREYFKKTRIYQEMLILFSKLSQETMPVAFMKWRVLLFKIITALSFDDSLDQYRASIRKTISLLKKSATGGEWVKILYDLTGIFETIDGRLIFRYFLRKLLYELSFPELLRELFGLGFADPKLYLKDVMHLSWTIVDNHNNRIDCSDGMESLYHVLSYIIPYWNRYLESDLILDTEETLLEVFNSFSGIIDGKHINICVLDNLARTEFRKFIKLIILSMCKTLETIESSAELSRALFNLALLITDKVTKQLFDLDDPQIGKGVHYFIVQVMKKLMTSFDLIAGGLFEENLLEPMLKTIDQYYNFVRINSNKLHLMNLMANIEFVVNDFQAKEAFLETIIKVAMEFRHHFSAPLQQIANISVNLIDFYKLDSTNLIGRLGLNDSRDIQEFERIFRHVRESIEDYQWLSLQMKDWLKVRSRFSTFTPDDY